MTRGQDDKMKRSLSSCHPVLFKLRAFITDKPAAHSYAGSDQLRAAIRATLPSAKSGDRDLMLKQLNAFDQQVDALHTGVPGTAVNPKTPMHKAAGGSSNAGGTKRKPNW